MRGIAAMAIVFALALPAVALAADGDGAIQGQITNGTADGGSVAGLEVTIERYLDGELDDSQLVTTGEDGRFFLEGLPTAPEYYYRASLFYQDAEYFSDYAFFEESEIIAYASLVVYDATTSSAAISITRSHTIVQVEVNGLYITEVYAFLNDSDLTYVGSVEVAEGKFATLSFPLPNDASDPALGPGLMECCIFGVDGGFVHSMPVMPGETDVMYSYGLPYAGDSHTFERNVLYPTGSYDLVIQGAGIEIDSPDLAVSTSTTESGVSFTLGSATDLSPGDILLAEVLGLPRIGGDMTVVIVVVTLVVLIAGSLLFRVTRKRGGTEVTVAADDGGEDERYRLLVLIAGLDDDFESGKLTEDAYRRRRDAVKAELEQLIQRTA